MTRVQHSVLKAFMDTAQAVRKQRQLQGLSQDELANRVGCSKRTIERVEAGGEYRPATIREIAEALKINVQTLTSPGSPEPNLMKEELLKRLRNIETEIVIIKSLLERMEDV